MTVLSQIIRYASDHWCSVLYVKRRVIISPTPHLVPMLRTSNEKEVGDSPSRKYGRLLRSKE